jgi:hypothetical protein
VSALTELAAFVLSFCDEQPETFTAPCGAAVAGILASPVFADQRNRQAALFGYATEIGASRAGGFDAAWKPVGCI